MLANSPGRLIVAEDGSQRYFGSSSNIAMLHDWSSSMFRPSIRCVLKDGNHAIQQAGLEWPDDPEQEEWLTKQYFTWHNPLSHEVIEHDYMAAKAAFNSGEATELYSPALRNAILALGACYSQQNGAHASLKHQEPAEFFALRARVYLDVEMDSPCLATAQSTLLLAAYEFGRGLDSRGWVYAGMNIHLLIDLGLCPDLSRGQRVAGPGYQSDALQRSRSELFRASFSSNMLWAMYTGRPSLLSKLAVDRGNKHILTKTDELLWENFQRQGLDSLRDLEAQSRAMGIPHYLYQLLRIMEAIRASPQHGMRDADDTTPEIFINTMSKVLDDWMTSLPKPLRVDTVEMDHDQEIATSKHASAILLLHMQYHLARILLYRPFLCVVVPDNIQTASDYLEGNMARQVCTESAADICCLLNLYRRQFTLRSPHIQLIPIVTTAGMIQASHSYMPSPRSGTPDTRPWRSSRPERTVQEDVLLCIQALAEIGQTFKASIRGIEIITSLRRGL
ncbi:uncharacterized protein Z520_01259 [Fonsecaea multimorphosa CBS 102226]|uniref:Xylanolytic transcriptional activator regulatory domain-containing protein n=1 Tax=Fonsecaea multimorphosa CBS 102226 TaxID=1442371 RepID=A0A0D2L177_9EURO|nr:uncharacterized protein Z520_01259 [Fonsecaea multimorphosa CBS 102226]KIY02794.1 hypothetical protein Z520_01259 [Fonsecaea multimorphosa CBS 102226]